MTRGAALASFGLLVTLAAGTVRAQTAVITDVSASSDAEHFDALQLRAGGLFGYASAFEYSGVAAQTTHYTSPGWQRDAEAILVLWRRQNRDTLAGTIAEWGVVRIAGRTRLIGDATWSLRPNAHTGFELLLTSDLVETQRALDRGTTYTFAGVSAERQLTERLTVIGLAGGQHFTDGNERTHLRGRVIFLLIPEQGITAQLRWRQYGSSRKDVGDAYFNPRRYREWQAALAMRKRHAGWLWTATLGAGQETIGGGDRHGTALAELRTEATLGKGVRLVFHGAYNRSAGFVAADGYWYRTVGMTMIVPFPGR